MTDLTPKPAPTGPARMLLFLQTPSLWPLWPFLPMVRHWPGKIEECGIVYDSRRSERAVGYRCTVFLVNLFEIPCGEADLLQLPREVYDTFEDLAAAGWQVD